MSKSFFGGNSATLFYFKLKVRLTDLYGTLVVTLSMLSTLGNLKKVDQT